MNGAELFVKSLENEGVTHIFGVAGEENLHLLEAISKSKITYIPTRHEQGAAFMAATWGRLTGKPGVCLSTLGPGATNLVTGAAYSFLGGMPMVMITGQKPIRERVQGNFQIIDVVRMFDPIVKYTTQVTDANMIPRIVREAFQKAEVEKPGPSHIELPKDVSVDPTNKDVIEPTPVIVKSALMDKIQEGVEMIEASERPLLMVSSAANRKNLSKVLSKFVEKTGIPFVSTQMGKGAIDERHDLYLGTLALSSRDYIHCALDQADLVIAVGYDLSQKIPFSGSNVKILHINFFQEEKNPYYRLDHEIIGNVEEVFSVFVEEVKKKFTATSDFTKLKPAIEKKILENSDSDKFPVLPQRIVRDVRKSVPEDGIICLDNGMYKLWFSRAYKAYFPNTILLDNALATMGAGLPSAIAAKMLNPKKFVMAVTGDGGFMMSSQELETAIRLKLDLVILLINDNGFGMIEWEQKEKNYKEFGLKFGNPDFVKYAESFGARGVRVERANDLSDILEYAKQQGGVWLVEVPVDYSENHRVFTEALNHNTCEF